MNHYNKVRATLAQMTNLKASIEQLIQDCENELAREPIDTSKTIEELKLDLELDELQAEFEKIQAQEQKNPEAAIKTVISQLKHSETERKRKQKLFLDKERIIASLIKPLDDTDTKL